MLSMQIRLPDNKDAPSLMEATASAALVVTSVYLCDQMKRNEALAVVPFPK
jgi:hypothetical protein